MEWLNNVIDIVGAKTLIIAGVVLLVLIAVIIVYRLIKLRNYRKQIVDLENSMNAVKSLPIQYKLGRVKGIARNMQEVKAKYDEFETNYNELCNLQSEKIVPLINDIDEALYYRRLRGIKRRIGELNRLLQDYEKNYQRSEQCSRRDAPRTGEGESGSDPQRGSRRDLQKGENGEGRYRIRRRQRP